MSVSNAFTAAGLGNGILVLPGQSVTYEVTGTFTGFCFLERLIKGGVEQIAATLEDTALAAATFENTTGETQQYRWRSAVATGTATATITDVAGEAAAGLDDVRGADGTLLLRYRDDGVEIPNLVGAGARTVTGNQDDSGATVTGTPLTTVGVGTKNGSTVSVVERGNGIVHKTVLTLTATPITLTDDADVGQFGGVKLYDFPAGNIKILGAVVDLILTLDDALWTDAAEGDFALGSALVDDADALDGLFIDILASTAIAALTAQVGPMQGQSAADVVPLGSAGGADDDLNLNVRIDDAAAHVTDTGSTMTGTVTIAWMNLGDF